MLTQHFFKKENLKIFMFKKSLFIFRRDLRLEDNTALIEALKQSEEVIPCFIFDPRQIGEKNKFKSNNALCFMQESLEDLNEELKKKGGRLIYFYGKAEEFLERFLSKRQAEAIFINRDYTPFSKKRDKAIEKACKKNSKAFFAFDDALLNPPEKVLTGKREAYKIFTPYYNKTREIKVKKTKKNNYKNYFKGNFKFENHSMILNLKNYCENKKIKGGRKEALKILKNIENFEHYDSEKDYPYKKTTNLSAHLKFGTVSVREVFQRIEEELGGTSELLRQLYWRDFFTQLAYNYPRVFGNNFNKKFDKIKWENNSKKFNAWKEGKTGVPIVDAGMRELNETGFMHNRVRMITASFLVKDLHIDWRKGERYFAQKLLDYDPAVNNGNWQWNAGTGADAQPFFRIFNPWTQAKKFDPNAEYIKTWVKELKEKEAREIFAIEKGKLVDDYVKPIVEHKKEAEKAKQYFNKIK
jgi:deoxyribodipyrimidine photo-lyase